MWRSFFFMLIICVQILSLGGKLWGFGEKKKKRFLWIWNETELRSGNARNLCDLHKRIWDSRWKITAFKITLWKPYSWWTHGSCVEYFCSSAFVVDLWQSYIPKFTALAYIVTNKMFRIQFIRQWSIRSRPAKIHPLPSNYLIAFGLQISIVQW